MKKKKKIKKPQKNNAKKDYKILMVINPEGLGSTNCFFVAFFAPEVYT